MKTEIHNFEAIGKAFGLMGNFEKAEPYGSGHINDTFVVVYNQGGTRVRYIYQRINDRIFRDIPKLMDNIVRVTEHQQKRIKEAGLSEPGRRSLKVIPADGLPYYRDENGSYWRAYFFIERAKTYDRIVSKEQARSAAAAFACFQKELVDLPGARLTETIPDFHNTRKRFERLMDVIGKDACNRAAGVKEEIRFFEERRAVCDLIINAMAEGLVPERVTHNDTKLNNVMIDDETDCGICVIDLDTVMPGSVLYDFGDMIRTATNPGLEDTQDLSQVCMRFDMFTTIADGYLTEGSQFMTPAEIGLLPMAGRIITMETGIRFLTDYLEGDIYFKIHRTGHNLDRCRTQIQMVRSIESQLSAMDKWLKERLVTAAV